MRLRHSGFIIAGVLFCAVGITGCHAPKPHQPSPVPPAWALYPKPADSVYCYVVGASVNQSSPAAAREEAYQDALRQLSRQIVSEAGLGLAALPPGGILLPMEGVEIMPGCIYIEPAGNTFSGYVQVSLPISKKRQVVESLRAAQGR